MIIDKIFDIIKDIKARSGDFYFNIVNNEVPGYIDRYKFGRNPNTDFNDPPEDMWNGSTVYSGQPVDFTPETIEVFSDDAADTSAGTGARTIRMFGLESPTSTSYTSEDFVLNGVTPVPSTKTWWRVNRGYTLTAGSGGANAGTITVRATGTPAVVFARLPLGLNQTTIGCSTIPAEHKAILKRLTVSIVRASGAAGSALITFKVREPGSVFRVLRPIQVSTGGLYDIEFTGGLVIPAGSDIKFTIENVSDNATQSSGAFEYILVKQ